MILWGTLAHGIARAEADSTEARVTTDSLRSVQSKQVVVTGTRNEVLLKDSPVRVEVIGQQRIKNTAMVGLGDVLKEQSGLMMQSGVRTGVQMNGLSPDYTLILIDGQPMVGRVAGVIDLNRVSVGNIERIEIVKGPMSSMYGSEALAGVINIITKRPADGWSGNYTGQYTTKGPLDNRLEAGYSDDDIEASAFVNYKKSAAFTLPLDTNNIPYAGFQDGTLHGKVMYTLDKHWKLKGWLRLFGSETRGSFVESILGQIAANTGSVQQYDFSSTVGTEYIEGNARLTLNAYGSTYIERYNFDVKQGSAGSVDDLTRRIGRLYGQYDLILAGSARLTLGGEFLYDDISGSRYVDTATPGSFPFYRTGVGFAQWEGQPTDWISYVLSARYDGNSVYGSAVSPRFSILWKPGDHYRFSGSIGSGFKAPDFRQLFVSFSNRLPGAGYDLIGAARLGNTLQPERSLSYDVSMRYHDGHYNLTGTTSVLYDAEIRLFRNDLSNLIEFYLVEAVQGRSIYSYRNISKAYTQGAEVNTNIALAVSDVGMFSLGAGYQLLYANDVQVLAAIDAGNAGTVNGEPLTRAQYFGLWNRSRNSGTVRLQFTSSDKSWTSNLRFQFVGRYGDESLDKNGIVISNPARKVLDRPDEFVGGYTVVNLAVTKQFEFQNIALNSLQVSAGINNVLNVLHPTLIPGLVGLQFFVQSGIRF